jgi:IS30 family transposase
LCREVGQLRRANEILKAASVRSTRQCGAPRFDLDMEELGCQGERWVDSAVERNELWERWRRGESISDIGRALDRAPGTIFCTLTERGGVAPPPRRRSRLALTLREREEISRGIAAGESARGIAARLGRSPATIAREIARHGGRRRYRAADADGRAWRSARRPQVCELASNPALRELVAGKLSEDWSPEQIAGWLKLEFGEDHTRRVSHETIYL